MANRLRPAAAFGILALIALLGWPLLTALPWGQHGSQAAPADPIRVVTTTSVFADLIARVGGERVQVMSLVPMGGDPHAWDPTPREIRAVSDAHIFVYNGLGLEPWVPRLLAGAGRPDLVTVELGSGLASRAGERDHQAAAGEPAPGQGSENGAGHDHHPGEINPHLWLDITYAIQYVRRIQQALAAHDPAGAAYYQSRAGAYAAELEELDRWFHAQVQRIPPERRVLVTYHNAYEHMARRYGLELAGFLVHSPEQEPSAQVMAQLARVLRQRQVNAVFVEPQIDSRLAEALARETGARVGTLYTDSLTDDVPTYVAMMRANAQALVELLR